MGIRRVGVIGAGVMGTGLAQSLAQAQCSVVLVDLTEAILARSAAELRKSLRLARMLDPQGAAEPTVEVMGRITFTTDYELLGDVDFVVENVVEKWEVKARVYAQLEAACPPAAIFAANTSAISITRIAGATGRPAQVLGMHFMNPVPMKPMVEVIRGYHTSDATLETARGLLAAMGKSCVVVQDMPGFVSNRVLMLMINEAAFLLQDQVATAEEVDTIFRSCFGHKMGPLETADLIGLDTILYSIDVLYESYNDSKYRPCPLLKKLVDAGLHGRKSGRGFYAYE